MAKIRNPIIVGKQSNLQEKTIAILENGNRKVEPDVGFDGLSSVNISVNTPQLTLGEKSVIVIENGEQNIFPDSGYDGMSKVSLTTNVAQKIFATSLSVKYTRYSTYFKGESFNPLGTILTVGYSNGATKDISTGYTFVPTGALAAGDRITFSYVENDVSVSGVGDINIIGDAEGFDEVLDRNSWLAVKAASERELGASLWSVGDTHQVTINGTMIDNTSSPIVFDNYLTNVYIIGFNHNSTVEGEGISFGGFKAWNETSSEYTDICLQGSRMKTDSSNAGGWKKCRMRNIVLGSTDTQDGNASPTTATNPVANSLMSCLPSDLRFVLKPITKWTDNTGGGQGNIEEYISSTIDYLPLMSNYEVFGADNYANTYEKDHQARYSYYAAGNSRIKYNHDTLAAQWYWGRSPRASDSNLFCRVSASGNALSDYANLVGGVSPIFLI